MLKMLMKYNLLIFKYAFTALDVKYQCKQKVPTVCKVSLLHLNIQY